MNPITPQQDGASETGRGGAGFSPALPRSGGINRDQPAADGGRDAHPTSPSVSPASEPPYEDLNRSPAGSTPPPSPAPSRLRMPRVGGWWLGALLLGVAVVAGVLGVQFSGRIGFATASVWGWVGGRGDDAAWQAEGEGIDRKVQLYQSGMHPWIITTEPGNCPICGMKLEPIDPSKLTGELVIDPRVVQNMGVRTQEVTTGPLEQTIRTVGRVTYDETRVRTVNTKFDGWIEELFVDTEGQRVEAGDRLFSVYSPKLFAAQEEYLSAYRNRDISSGQTLLDSARTRLSYFDLTDEQITALEERGEPQKSVMVTSPYSGVVTQKHANEGMRIDPGMMIYTIADLSEVWVQATVYEQQLPFLEEGAQATMTLSYLPGRSFEGRVDYVYPYLADRGREVKVRLQFANSDGVLKPGMFANVRIQSEVQSAASAASGGGEAVLVPRSAVIDTGERQVAFVSKGEGRFEPRDLELGVETSGDRVQVLSGLEAGERVVTSGQFLLDSESKLRESLAKMVEGNPAGDDMAAVPMAGREGLDTTLAAEVKNATSQQRAAVQAAVDAYLDVQAALTKDDPEGAKSSLSEIARGLEDSGLPDVASEVAKLAGIAAAADSLEVIRQGFEPLSLAMEKLILAVPPGEDATLNGSGNDGLYRAYCPMEKKTWLQAGSGIRNPYDPSMLTCGSIQAQLPLGRSMRKDG